MPTPTSGWRPSPQPWRSSAATAKSTTSPESRCRSRTSWGSPTKPLREAADVRIDRFRLDDFDIRTRFALSWARQHARRVTAGSEARWQRLSYDIADPDAAGLLVKEGGGARLAYGDEAADGLDLRDDSPVIDIVLAVAAEGRSVNGIGDALHHLGRATDEMLWAAIAEMARLLGEGDRDGQVWAWAIRNRNQILGRAETVQRDHHQATERAAVAAAQKTLPLDV